MEAVVVVVVDGTAVVEVDDVVEVVLVEEVVGGAGVG